MGRLTTIIALDGSRANARRQKRSNGSEIKPRRAQEKGKKKHGAGVCATLESAVGEKKANRDEHHGLTWARRMGEKTNGDGWKRWMRMKHEY